MSTAPTLRGPVKAERPDPVARSVVRRDTSGKELGTVDLEPTIFGIEPNLAVLHQVVNAQLAAARSGTQSTKTRAEVRGGGAKPWRQKGTGRARQGSSRSPHWAGGGVALGPKPRSYRQRTPKKMIRLALCSALSDRAAEDKVALVDTWGWEVPRTKDALDALRALGLDGRVLVVLGADDVVAERSFGNLPEIQTALAAELCAYDVLRNDWVVFTDESLPGSTWEAPEAAEEEDEAPAAEVEEVADPAAAPEDEDETAAEAADAGEDVADGDEEEGEGQ